MKYNCSKTFFIITALYFICFGSDAQTSQSTILAPLPIAANKIVYYDTVFLDTTYSKTLLFDNAQTWYTHNFESSDNRLTIDNSDAGSISGSGILNFKKHKTDYKDLLFVVDIVTGKGFYVYKFYNLFGYDNGVKFDYSDMYSEERYPGPKPEWPREIRENKLTDMDTSIKDVIGDLKKKMTERETSKKSH